MIWHHQKGCLYPDPYLLALISNFNPPVVNFRIFHAADEASNIILNAWQAARCLIFWQWACFIKPPWECELWCCDHWFCSRDLHRFFGFWTARSSGQDVAQEKGETDLWHQKRGFTERDDLATLHLEDLEDEGTLKNRCWGCDFP